MDPVSDPAPPRSEKFWTGAQIRKKQIRHDPAQSADLLPTDAQEHLITERRFILETSETTKFGSSPDRVPNSDYEEH